MSGYTPKRQRNPYFPDLLAKLRKAWPARSAEAGTIQFPSQFDATRRTQDIGAKMPPVTTQQAAAESTAPAAVITTGTVPRYRYQNVIKSRDAYRKRVDDLTVELAEARALMVLQRQVMPDAAALIDARRHNSELAHALGSVLVVFERQGKVSGNTAHFIRELLANKGYNPDDVKVAEVNRG